MCGQAESRYRGSFAVFALFAGDPSFRGSWQDEPVRIVCSAAREK